MLKPYWDAVGRLRPEQAAKLPAVEWLLDSSAAGSVRRSGRTTVMALAFLRDACTNSGRQIPVFDHILTGGRRDDAKRVVDRIRAIVGPAHSDLVETREGARPTIRVSKGWSHTLLDPVQGPCRTRKREEKAAHPVLSGYGEGQAGWKESILDDVRSTVAAAIALGVPVQDVLDAVDDAVVRPIMSE